MHGNVSGPETHYTDQIMTSRSDRYGYCREIRYVIEFYLNYLRDAN